MIEMLKEQVYHNTIVTSLSQDATSQQRQVSSNVLLKDLDKYSQNESRELQGFNYSRNFYACTLYVYMYVSVILGGDRNTVDQLELLQQQMLTQQEQSTAALTSSLKEVHMIFV